MMNTRRPISDLSTMDVLRTYGIEPKKSLGQNFITNESILEDIVRLARVTPDDNVLEIGAGVGNLSQHLAMHARQVVSIEIDLRFCPILTQLSEEIPNLMIVFEDVMELDLTSLFDGQPYMVVGNIPYNITSALIRKLVTSRSKPERIVLTIQKEVAERIVEGAGQYSLLALSIQIFGTPKILKTIKAGSFYPKPNVDSAVVDIDLFDSPFIEAEMIDDFFYVIRAGFSQKRKTLINSLTRVTGLSKDQISAVFIELNLKPMIRPQELTLAQWKALISKLRPNLNKNREEA